MAYARHRFQRVADGGPAGVTYLFQIVILLLDLRGFRFKINMLYWCVRQTSVLFFPFGASGLSSGMSIAEL